MSSVDPLVYLLDVEGTTSPISLVAEQLFPYARKHLPQFLHQHFKEPEIEGDIQLLEQENRAEAEADCPTAGGEITDESQALIYLNWLMDRDRKSTALKSLQGRIWKSGFEAGELVGAVFPDVPEALARWSRRAKVAIYSSGSVEAQRLLFRYSSAGDQTRLITCHFDTRIGVKTSPDSYRAIAKMLEVETSDVLFLSDLLRELDPAREAGCQTRLSLRVGNAAIVDSHRHMAIRSFAEVD